MWKREREGPLGCLRHVWWIATPLVRYSAGFVSRCILRTSFYSERSCVHLRSMRCWCMFVESARRASELMCSWHRLMRLNYSVTRAEHTTDTCILVLLMNGLLVCTMQYNLCQSRVFQCYFHRESVADWFRDLCQVLSSLPVYHRPQTIQLCLILLTSFLQCFDTNGWVIWPVKWSMRWPMKCQAGRYAFTHSLVLLRLSSSSWTWSPVSHPHFYIQISSGCSLSCSLWRCGTC